MKKFFALPMAQKLLVKPRNFAFGYVGGSPIEWRNKWWMEGLHVKVMDEAIRNVVTLAWPDDEAFSEEFM